MNKRACFFAFLVALLPSLALALEAKTSGFTLEINESRGRYSLYANTAEGKKPLYVAEDPTTSYFSVLANNRIYRLGDSFDFRQSAQTSANGGSISWTSSRITVESSFDISRDSYAVLTIKLKNVSEVAQDVGFRMLLDTYLGEDGTHFVLPSGAVSNEIELTDIPAYVQSGIESDTALFLLFSYLNATKPDRIVLANWKRLDDTSWSYSINTNRNFSVIPYSINDSAVSLYYDPVSLAPNAERSLVIVFGTKLPVTQTTASAAATASTSSTTAATASSAATSTSSLATIDALIKKIDAILQAGRDPTEAELAELRSAVDSLKEHRGQTE